MTELANKSGLSQQMVSFVERELRNPSLDTLLRITAVLEVRLSDVIRQAEQK
jgi:transcriptional regulator with XRE-family HTH domain